MASAITSRKPQLEVSLSKLLNNNFDADSLTCIQTCLKVVDNILQKPGDEKVRSMRYQNPAMQKKIISKQGGGDILYSCGFVLQEEEQKLLMTEGEEAPFFVLHNQNEDTDWLVYVRHTLSKVAVHQLKCRVDDLPKFQPPKRKLAVGNTSSEGGGGFNVYQGTRFDGQSAAVGQSLGPPKGWKSTTESRLESLEKRQAQLAKKHQVAKERNWVALRPGEVMNPASSAMAQTQSSSSTSSSREDSALIASHIQKQQKSRQEEANRGFTTKAMRDLERMKKQKVYSHTLLAISFPDGSTCKGQFLPVENINTVMESIRQEVLVGDYQAEEFELYITPPRTKLLSHQTLADLDLVPAAKVYVSWKSPVNLKAAGLAYLNSALFQSSGGPAMGHGVWSPCLGGRGR